jgi:hypothetical protein
MNRLHEYFITVFLAFVVQVMQEIGGMFFFAKKGGMCYTSKLTQMICGQASKLT